MHPGYMYQLKSLFLHKLREGEVSSSELQGQISMAPFGDNALKASNPCQFYQCLLFC